MKKKVKVAIGLGAVVTIALLLGICFMVISRPWRYVSIKKSIGVSEEEFMQKMEKLDEYYNTTNFSENAEQLLNTAQEKGYNEYIAPAVMCIATDGGTDTRGSYNYWPIYTLVDKRAEYMLEGVRINFQFATSEASIECFFNILAKCGNVTYEEFSREWISIGKMLHYPMRVEGNRYGKELYEKVQWIKSL